MPRPNKVSWHPSGRWCFAKTIAGQRKVYYASPEIPHTDAGRKKATKWMQGVLEQLAERVVEGGDWTVNDIALAYTTWLEQQVEQNKLADITYQGHRKHLRLVCRAKKGGRAYGDILARELTPRDAADLVKIWEKESRGATTIRNRIGSLQSCLNWAARPRVDRPMERIIEVNPIAGFELPKAIYQGERYAPAEEVEGFLRWLDEHASKAKGKSVRFEKMIAALIRFAAETGCRPGELCVLQWDHIYAEKKVIVLPPTLHKTGRKTNKPRIIVLNARLIEILETLRADPHRHATHVFTHRAHRPGKTKAEEELRAGDPWNSNALSRRVKDLRRLAIKAGVLKADTGLERLHLYKLRHTKITNDIQDGANIADVAKMSGNSVKIIENTYLHTQIDHLLNVAAEIEAKRKGAGNDGG